MRVMFKRSVSMAAILAASATFSVSAIAQTPANPQTGAPATGPGTAIPSKAGSERQPMAAPGAPSTGPGATTTPSTSPMPPATGAGTAIPSKAGAERQPPGAVGESTTRPSMKGMSAEEKKAARAERKAERKANRPTDQGTTNDRKSTGTN